MKKINIITWFEVKLPDGEVRNLRAETNGEYSAAQTLQVVFDYHSEKIGSIERKLLTSNE